MVMSSILAPAHAVGPEPKINNESDHSRIALLIHHGNSSNLLSIANPKFVTHLYVVTPAITHIHTHTNMHNKTRKERKK